MEDALKQKNLAIKNKIKEEKNNLRQRKDKALKIAIMIKEQEREIVKLEKRNVKLKKKEELEAQLLQEQKLTVSEREKAKQDLEELNSKFQDYKSIIKYNEQYIQNIENKMSKAKLLDSELQNVMKKAHHLITEEVKFPLIKTNNEIPMPKNILQNLERLFEEATILVFESQQNLE